MSLKETPATTHTRPGRLLGSPNPARKLSVTMPEELASAVRKRVGRGSVSSYVAAAVEHQLELDLATELAQELSAEYGPVDPTLLAQARASWPDAE